ncbi:hypothetical protein HanRHA438_Chr16g0752641 [Helianthus annuus]|nr:hypothetical protein HanIR_Chr16g0805101 [Helianthus annuus]KAJ0644313.1 hypothetical protein HanOQP8_Chr16g0610641 [Helianthus annuus]KAJ0835215.1 hypothetical protein HanRHA438_Chr16g0752641 [Helianthus annuus]
MIWRHPDAVLNELEPSDSELDNWFLKSIRACPSRLHPFPEPLLVLMGISKLWDKPDRDPVLIRDGQVMSALDFIKSDDTWMLLLLRMRMLWLEVPSIGLKDRAMLVFQCFETVHSSLYST